MFSSKNFQIVFSHLMYNMYNSIFGTLLLLMYGERRGVCRNLVGKPEGKRPLGRPRLRWVDNINADNQEVECGGMDWIVPA
jgi:hypothetical protein